MLMMLCPSVWSLAGEQPALKQKSFASPELAVQALVGALRSDDQKGLLEILGSGAMRVLASGDAVADKRARATFVEDYDQANRIVRAGEDKAVLEIGKAGWPLPIPIVQRASAWIFDTKAGEEEMLNRRIGRNELAVIQVMLAYVDAQNEYASKARDDSGVRSYAMKIRSSPGKRDGLYWPVKHGEEPSPLGPLAAGATAEGYGKGKPDPSKLPAFHGYHYRVLTGQGSQAPGGAYSYVARGRMIGGFGLVAYPARYGSSGIMTFVVNQDGVVYEKDLGPGTAQAAGTMTLFNPDQSWRKVQ